MENFYFVLFLVYLMLYISNANQLIIKKRENERLKMQLRRNKEIGGKIMSLEILNECVGKTCTVASTASLGGLKGKILSVDEVWVKIETKKEIRIVRLDTISEIIFEK